MLAGHRSKHTNKKSSFYLEVLISKYASKKPFVLLSLNWRHLQNLSTHKGVDILFSPSMSHTCFTAKLGNLPIQFHKLEWP